MSAKIPILFNFHLRILLAMLGLESPLGRTELRELPRKLFLEAFKLQRAEVLRLELLKEGAMEI